MTLLGRENMRRQCQMNTLYLWTGGSIMKYFTNWSVYTIKVVIPILHLIYIFPHIDLTFVVSLIKSTTRIFIYVQYFYICPALALLISMALQTVFVALLYNRHSAFNAPIITLHLYSLHLFLHPRCWYWCRYRQFYILHY